MYSSRAGKIDDISVLTIYQRNRNVFFFLKMYFVTRSKLAFTRSMLKCNSDFTKKSCLAATTRQGAIQTIALPVARFLHSLAIYNSMGLASQLGYFRLDGGNLAQRDCVLCVHRCPHRDTLSSGQFIIHN